MPQLVGHSLGLNALRFPGAGGGDGFTVNAVNFDGTNDYLTRGAELTGAVDGENILRSMWFKIDNAANDGNVISLDRSTGGQISTQTTASNEIKILLQSSAAILFQADSINVFDSTTNTGWHHLLVAAQLDVTPLVQIYLDDVALSMNITDAATQGNIDFTTNDWAIGAIENGNNKITGDLAEVYTAAEFLDLTVEDNRRKFITAGIQPVNLGSDGSTPTGTAAIIFFSGITSTWHTNDGTGGGFTENGALTDAATSPSD